jgi:hypothetical protein
MKRIEIDFRQEEIALLKILTTICNYSAITGCSIPKIAARFLFEYFEGNKEIVANLIDGNAEIWTDGIEVYEPDLKINELAHSIVHWERVSEEEYYSDYDEKNDPMNNLSIDSIEQFKKDCKLMFDGGSERINRFQI